MKTSGIRPVTTIGDHRASGVIVRGLSLEEELLGKATFTEALLLGLTGRKPSPAQCAVTDACLVALMEGGINASSVVARLVADTVPGQVQVAVAAGLLTVGDKYAGTALGCGQLLERVAAARDPRAESLHLAQKHREQRQHIPGLGHGTHDDADPRAQRLLEIAGETNLPRRHRDALETLRQAANEFLQRQLVVNVTGAIAAVLLDAGLSVTGLRLVSVVARAGGLGAHVIEEAERPAATHIWETARDEVRYQDPSDESG